MRTDITLRNEKLAELSWGEMDANFSRLTYWSGAWSADAIFDVEISNVPSRVVGTGWVGGAGDWAFDIPPGDAFHPLEFTQCEDGKEYRITFDVAGTLTSSVRFRPGEVAQDIVIDTVGSYDQVFTARRLNGVPRFTVISGANISFSITNLRIYERVGGYQPYEQVRDGGWLAIANKLTEDRPAPQPSAPPTWDIPTAAFTENANPNGLVLSGHQYVFTSAAMVEQIDVWAPELTGDTNYRVLIIDNSDPANPIVEIITEPILNLNDWTPIAVGRKIIPPGKTYVVLLDCLNSGSDTIVTGGWTRGANSNANPAAQQWNRTSAGTTLRIDKTDLNSTDRSSELLGIVPGSTIQIASTDTPTESRSWVVQSTTDGGSSVNYGVIDAATGPGGEPPTGTVCTMTATVPVAASTKYVEDLDGWATTGQPDWATCSGVLELSGVVQTVPGSQFGVRLSARQAYVSPDWDLQAYYEL